MKNKRESIGSISPVDGLSEQLAATHQLIRTQRAHITASLQAGNHLAFADESARIGNEVLIGPGTYIGAHSIIGDNCDIGMCVHIGDNVRIGSGTVIRSFATIESNTVMGNENHISSYAVIGGKAQDRTDQGDGTVIIGHGNAIHEFVTVHKGAHSQHGNTTLIGDSNIIMTGSHIAHDTKLGDRNVLVNCVELGGLCTIGNDVTLHSGCKAVPFTQIGDGAFCKANSQIRRHVPPFCIAAGEERNFRIKAKNTHVLKKYGWTAQQIADFHTIVMRTLKAKEAPGSVRERYPDEIFSAYFDFLASTHGPYVTCK